MAERGLFLRGLRLVVSYVKTHPGPFLISVGRFDGVRARVDRPDRGARPRGGQRPAAGVQRRRGVVEDLARDRRDHGRRHAARGRDHGSPLLQRRRAARASWRRSARGSPTATGTSRSSTTRRRRPASCSRTWRPTSRPRSTCCYPIPFAIGVLFLVLFAMISLFATDRLLALIGVLLCSRRSRCMNRSFARRMEGPAQPRAGADRRRLVRRPRVRSTARSS